MKRRLARASTALVVLAAIGLGAAAADGAWSGPTTPTWPASRIEVFPGTMAHVEDVLRSVAPHHDHQYGIISVQFLTCGPKIRILTPSQMAKRPVRIQLVYRGREVASADLVRQPRFNFLVVGPPAPHLPPRGSVPRLSSVNRGWSPGFLLKANGEVTSLFLGGLPGIAGVIISYPLRRPAHPCSTASPDY